MPRNRNELIIYFISARIMIVGTFYLAAATLSGGLHIKLWRPPHLDYTLFTLLSAMHSCFDCSSVTEMLSQRPGEKKSPLFGRPFLNGGWIIFRYLRVTSSHEIKLLRTFAGSLHSLSEFIVPKGDNF